MTRRRELRTCHSLSLVLGWMHQIRYNIDSEARFFSASQYDLIARLYSYKKARVCVAHPEMIPGTSIYDRSLYIMLTQVSERCFLTCGYLVLICREGARPEPDIERHIVGVVGMLQRLSSK